MKIPDDLKKCVCFLGIKLHVNPPKPIKYYGTGFVVSFPGKKINSSHLYIVTAKHVQEKLIEADRFYIRVNVKGGGSVDIEAPYKEVKWYIHSIDGAADVAAIPIGLDIRHFDFSSVPVAMFVRSSKHREIGIGEGDEVFMIGMLKFHTGLQRNIPVVRSGNIAMIPNERIFTNKYGEMEAYLIESRSIGGISGSPVFLVGNYEIDQQGYPARRIHLLGVIHGHWDTKPDTVDSIVEDDGESVNSGIAIVTPAQKILDILESPDAQKERDEGEDEFLSRNSPTPN